MLDPVTMFRDGGPFMYLLLMVAMLVPIAVVMSGVLAAMKLRVPAVIWFLPVVGAAAIGFFGTYLGETMALEAVSYASVEMQHKLAGAGLSIAFYTTVAGAGVGALAAGGFALVHGLGVLIGAGPDAELTLPHGVLAALVGVCALPLVAVGAYLGVLVALLAAAGLTLASLRASTDVEARTRTASGRVFVGTIGAMGVALAAICSAGWAFSELYWGQSYASAEMKGTLMAMAVGGLELRVGGLVLLALALCVATVASAAFAINHLASPRTLASGGAAAAAVLLGALVSGLLISPTMQLMEVAVDPQIARMTSLREGGVSPPEVEETQHGFEAGSTLRVTASQVTLDGVPVSPGDAHPIRGLTVEMDTALRIDVLVPYAGFFEGDSYWLAVGPSGLVSLPLQIVAAPPPGGITEVEFVDRGSVSFGTLKTGANRRLLSPDELASLRPGGPGSALLSRADRVQVWFDRDATSKDVAEMGVHLEKNQQEKPWVLRLDAAPSKPTEDELPEQTGEASPTAGVLGSGDVSVMGSLDRSLIKTVIKRHMNQIRYCYQRELAKDVELGGRIDIKFVVAKDGSVSTASIHDSTMRSVPVEKCIVGRFKRMKFPEPKGGGIVIVTYPFVFSPG